MWSTVIVLVALALDQTWLGKLQVSKDIIPSTASPVLEELHHPSMRTPASSYFTKITRHILVQTSPRVQLQGGSL